MPKLSAACGNTVYSTIALVSVVQIEG